MTSPLCARTQRALAINQKAGLTFPCIFIGLSGRDMGDNRVMLECEDDVVFRDGNGELSWSVIGILTDAALGTATRLKAGPRLRPATVQLQMQMTGASTRGHVVTEGQFVAFSVQDRVQQLFATATMRCGDTLIGHASAAFALLELPEGATQAWEPWLPDALKSISLDAVTFDSKEREALKICEGAETRASKKFPFIEHFWCGMPKAKEGKAHLDIKITPHLGNRVGHVHGGLLFGTAARVANAALPANMRLSNISALFVTPGLGPRLNARSTVIQQSRSFAVVHTQIAHASGKLVIDATSQHVAVAV